MDYPAAVDAGGPTATLNASSALLQWGAVPGDADTSLYLQYEARSLPPWTRFKFRVQAVVRFFFFLMQDPLPFSGSKPGCARIILFI